MSYESKKPKNVKKPLFKASKPRLEIAPDCKINVNHPDKGVIFMAKIKHDVKEVWLVRKHDPEFIDWIINYAKSLGYTFNKY